jgi:hypothetical protein
MGIRNTGIESIVFPSLPITDYLDEGLHIGIFLEVTKQLEQEEADRIIGKSRKCVLRGDDGSDKREIDQGGDESGKPANNASIGMDLDVSPLVSVL